MPKITYVALNFPPYQPGQVFARHPYDEDAAVALATQPPAIRKATSGDIEASKAALGQRVTKGTPRGVVTKEDQTEVMSFMTRHAAERGVTVEALMGAIEFPEVTPEAEAPEKVEASKAGSRSGKRNPITK